MIPLAVARADTGAHALAVQINATNRQQAAAWCGGQPWGMGVVIPTATGGEIHAELGAWIVRHDSGTVTVWADQSFRRTWRSA